MVEVLGGCVTNMVWVDGTGLLGLLGGFEVPGLTLLVAVCSEELG
jgi:hypothetical protein